MKLKRLLENIFTEEELKIAPSSFDIIGDIAIIKIPDELKKKEKEIGKQLLKFKNIKTVLKKEGKVEDKFRIRKYKFLAGEDKRETLHKEYGCKYKLNVETVYFSPRLGRERERIAKEVKEGEKILVMFAGIGPYAIQIAKNRNAEIFAVEINPKAVEYFRENAKLNKVENKIKIFEGDVREVVPKLKEKFDRIIMPLPKDAESFLDLAKLVAKKNAIVHLYVFAGSKEEAIKKIDEKVKVLNCVECGTYSKEISRYCIDFRFV